MKVYAVQLLKDGSELAIIDDPSSDGTLAIWDTGLQRYISRSLTDDDAREWVDTRPASSPALVWECGAKRLGISETYADD